MRVSNPQAGPEKEFLNVLFNLPLHKFVFVRIRQHWGDLEVEGDPIVIGILPTQTMELSMALRQCLTRTA